MKKIIEVNRQLAGVEDILWGVGKATQIRGGKEVEVTMVNAADIPFDEEKTVGQVVANGVQGSSIVTTSLVLDETTTEIALTDITMPAGRDLKATDLILSTSRVLFTITSFDDVNVYVEFFAFLAGPKGDKGDTGPQGIQGEKGDTGDTGPQGEGLHITGTVDAYGDLPTPGSVTDAYLVGLSKPRDLYTWDSINSVWVNQGAIQGPKGDTGIQGEQGIQGIKGDTGPKGDKGPAGTTTWSGITGKPTTFTPPLATQTVIGGAKMHVASGVLYIVTT